MPNITPGPWYWSDEYQTRDLTDTWSLIGQDNYGIFSCDGKCNSPQEVNSADATVIAALPDLMEALIELLDEAESGINTCPLTRQKARDALLKAGCTE